MMYAVLFEDDDAHAHKRAQHMSEHLGFLDRNAGTIRAAGPLVDTRADSPGGGLWLVEADTPGCVWRLVQSDPFWPTGLRKSVSVLEWKRVFVDGRRLGPGKET